MPNCLALISNICISGMVTSLFHHDSLFPKDGISIRLLATLFFFPSFDSLMYIHCDIFLKALGFGQTRHRVWFVLDYFFLLVEDNNCPRIEKHILVNLHAYSNWLSISSIQSARLNVSQISVKWNLIYKINVLRIFNIKYLMFTNINILLQLNEF